MNSPEDHSGSGLSLLDRLIDEEPENSAEVQSSVGDDARQIKKSLCRDLSALLNTRRREADFDAEFAESSNSILTFGILDFTSRNLRSRADQDAVRLSIERAIRQFEPRLTRVSVGVDESGSAMPVLRFEISAVLRLDSGAEDVVFNAGLHRDTRRVAVRGEAS